MNVVLQFAINPVRLEILALAIKSVSDAIRRKPKPDVLKKFAFALPIGGRSACTCVCHPIGGSGTINLSQLILKSQQNTYKTR